MKYVCLVEKYDQEAIEPKIDKIVINISNMNTPKKGGFISHPSLPFETCKITEMKHVYDEHGVIERIDVYMEEYSISSIDDYYRFENIGG